MHTVTEVYFAYLEKIIQFGKKKEKIPGLANFEQFQKLLTGDQIVRVFC